MSVDATELHALAKTLYKDYETFDGSAIQTVQDDLKDADTKVTTIVNGTTPIDVNHHVFAHALAIHDLVDDLYNALLEKAQPPERVDDIP
jgi:hypothetical protein